MCTLPGNLLLFLRSHLMQLFGDFFEAGDLYKRFGGGKIFFFFFGDNGYHWVLQWGGLVRRCLESDFCNCCMDKAYEEG